MNLIPKVNFFSTIKKFPACWVLPWPMLLLISAAMLRNLADKLYEKHKNAALDVCPLPFFILFLQFTQFWVLGFLVFDYWCLQIEGIVKQLATARDHDKIYDQFFDYGIYLLTTSQPSEGTFFINKFGFNILECFSYFMFH